jgi:hypothetical protein
MADKRYRDMTDDELRAEAEKWDAEVRNAESWGAAVAAAAEFRRECERELDRRQHVHKKA